MNSEKLRYWAQLIYIPDDPRLRKPKGSKHQEKIREILTLVKEARENPTIDVYERLRSVRPTYCPDHIPGFVNYCMYLQYQITRIDGFVRQYEGAKE